MPVPLPLQPSLFRTRNAGGQYSPPPASARPLSSTSSLAAAIQAFHAYLTSSLFFPHTVKAFVSDLSLLGKFAGLSRPVSAITTAELEGFLTYLRTSRGQPCSPKSLNRRVTALKSFFRWLHESQLVGRDPAAGLVYKRAVPPLPETLFDAECTHLITAASANSRTYLVVLLLLETGIKREELLHLKLSDFDLSNPYRPEVWIRSVGKRFKERKLRLPPETVAILKAYITEHAPQGLLFPFSERNLAYLLKEMGQKAGISKPITCQGLRDTFAVRQLKAGERVETVFEKLGLAPGSYNEETREKYLRLARPGI